MNYKIDAESINIGKNVIIEDGVYIKANIVNIGDYACIKKNTIINCFASSRCKFPSKRSVQIGDCSEIGHSSRVFVPEIMILDYCQIYDNLLAYGQKEIHIGNNCWLGENVILNSEESVFIGNNVGIGTNSQAWTHGYWGEDIEGCQINNQKPIYISDDSWIMPNCVIMPGSILRKRATLLTSTVLIGHASYDMLHSSFHGLRTLPLRKVYRKVPIKEKIKKIKGYILEFADSNDYNIIDKDRNKIKLINKSSNVYSFEFIEDYIKQPVGNNRIIICSKTPEQVGCERGTVFFLDTKKYIKQKTEIEMEFIKFMRSSMARFIPIDCTYSVSK